MKIAQNITELIGHTPLVKLNKLNEGEADVVLKLEYFNPANSIKDRPAFQIIEDAIKEGKINKDTLIIEPTSGNMGIGLAMVCAVKGLKIILVMPDSMSVERRLLMKAYGAEVELTPGALGMKGSVDRANELHKKYKNSFMPSQFENPSNPKVHYENTAEEIWQDTDGKIDILVAGVGTGGTISGIGKKLKEKNKNIKIVAVEPYSSPLLSKGEAGPHKIQGIGANFKPKNYDDSVVDEIITVTNEDAIETARNLTQKEGILSGFSGGASVFAATKLSLREENKNKLIVAILPDCGERYLSSVLYSKE